MKFLNLKKQTITPYKKRKTNRCIESVSSNKSKPNILSTINKMFFLEDKREKSDIILKKIEKDKKIE